MPYFNAPIYKKDKTQIGKVEEIMGPIHKYVRPRPEPAAIPVHSPDAGPEDDAVPSGARADDRGLSRCSR